MIIWNKIRIDKYRRVFNMAVYTYPAAFLEEVDGGYSVIFQDSLGGFRDTLSCLLLLPLSCVGTIQKPRVLGT